MTSGFADPVGAGVRSEGEADVVQALEEIGADLVRAVFAADDAHRGGLAVGERAGIVRSAGSCGLDGAGQGSGVMVSGYPRIRL
ncbi:hypothetical protein ACFCXA_29130 [Streptomyces virginiae]|uniref:hypothetical protein n=1 Tax=Streptomyces virginiae TaxID=1961 RepID=UPI0035E3B527